MLNEATRTLNATLHYDSLARPEDVGWELKTLLQFDWRVSCPDHGGFVLSSQALKEACLDANT